MSEIRKFEYKDKYTIIPMKLDTLDDIKIYVLGKSIMCNIWSFKELEEIKLMVLETFKINLTTIKYE